MVNLKFYGLGGQGVVTAAKILSVAVSLYENKFAITVPAYGHERRGAPVNTSIMIDDEPVLINSFVYEPDVVLVMDPTVIRKNVDVAEGIKPGSVLVLNTDHPDVVAEYGRLGFHTIYYTNATQIALDLVGQGIPNGSMLGALAAAGVVGIDSVERAIRENWTGKAGEHNASAARKAYDTICKA